jgi:hypothetical protein
MAKPILSIGLALALAGSLQAAEDGWLKTLDEGLQEAQKSGQAVLYVTTWKPGV